MAGICGGLVTDTPYDVAIIGAGIVGLAHALAAVRLGKRVVVIDRDTRANGASVRNFGFVTVTGQAAGITWERARRSREIWAEIAPQAGIDVLQQGLVMLARRPEAAAVLEAFAYSEMGRECQLLGPAAARQRYPSLAPAALEGALWSPHELRVESRDAVPLLASWLESAHGVAFRRGTMVHGVEPPSIETSDGVIRADTAIVCPGDDLLSLFPERLAAYRLTRCRLHMLRVAPPSPHWRMPAPVMSDLSLVRYPGYAALPEADALRERLETEQPEYLANGIHLIAVQGADGSLVIGDSHHYDQTPTPFSGEEVDNLIMEECATALGHSPGSVLERWSGTYPKANDRDALVDCPRDDVRLVLVSSGTGASTAFAIAEETLNGLLSTSCNNRGTV